MSRFLILGASRLIGAIRRIKLTKMQITAEIIR